MHEIKGVLGAGLILDGAPGFEPVPTHTLNQHFTTQTRQTRRSSGGEKKTPLVQGKMEPSAWVCASSRSAFR